MDIIKINNKIVSVIDFINCCKLNKKHECKYVKHEDDIKYRNNIMFDLKGINFAPEVQWTYCDLYEDE